MKQAILIVCGEEYERLPFLVEQFDERFNVYIHIDKKVIEWSLKSYDGRKIGVKKWVSSSVG